MELQKGKSSSRIFKRQIFFTELQNENLLHGPLKGTSSRTFKRQIFFTELSKANLLHEALEGKSSLRSFKKGRLWCSGIADGLQA